jgi:hypothetical protein
MTDLDKTERRKRTAADMEARGITRMAFRASEVGYALGCSQSKAYAMIASGEIPSIEIAGMRRVTVEVLEQLLKART